MATSLKILEKRCCENYPNEQVNNPTQLASYNTELANWDLFTTTLISDIGSSEILNSNEFNMILINSLDILQNQDQEINILDLATQEFTNCIIKAANISIPKKKLGAKPKPWWNKDLKDLRKAMIFRQRCLIKSNSLDLKQDYLRARNSYFLAIKNAKRKHWNKFLEKEDPKSIFKAMSYTKDKLVERIPSIKSTRLDSLETTFQGQCSSFRTTLFPTPPNAPRPSWEGYKPIDWKWPILSKIELENACLGKIKGKTLGPDLINQDIISRVYKAIPNMFYKLYSCLINIGYHPSSWRQAIGA